MSSASSTPPLSQGVGYGILLGLGFGFALIMIGVTFLLKRFHNEGQTAEEFNTAGRSVKSGLVAAAVVSSWTWAATLLQSTGVAYRYGISGPFWYASGATVQIILFATLAIELKRRAPHAHTFLEVARVRYGTATHAVFITFALMTNFLVTAMLITGGSAVIASLTGVDTVAGCFLIPVGVLIYTLFGGLKATMISDYTHGLIVVVLIIVFSLSAYATNSVLGSPGAVYDALVAAAERHPVEGNESGSYLTMRSREGGIFFVINIIGNFGTVFLDNGYWNKAISSSPVHALPGYILGGLAWFAIPFLCATTLGLAAVATEASPIFPLYPDRIPDAQVTAGLALPYAARALMGTGGAAGAFILLFFAVTSAFSSELIAVSSIWTYDIYYSYINPNASDKRLKTVSAASCTIWSFGLSAICVGLWYAGISMGYLYLLMGCIISSCVIPASLTLLWSGQNWIAAACSPPLGLACALIGWLTMAKAECGQLNVECTGSNMPMLVGNVTALLSPLVFIPVLTYTFGSQKYDWKPLLSAGMAADNATPEKQSSPGSAEPVDPYTPEQRAKLEKSRKIARWCCVALALCFLILWPMPMFGSGYIFSKRFFTGWIVVGMIWIWITLYIVGIFPLVQSRGTLFTIAKAVLGGGVARKAQVYHGENASGEAEGVVSTEQKRPKDDVESS